jgi:hypothetical protein
VVERIILFKLNEPTTRDEVAALTQAALGNLADVEELSVGVPADAASEKSWDLSVVLGVANLALLNTVLESPAFSRYLDVTLHGRCAVIKAWTFERLS